MNINTLYNFDALISLQHTSDHHHLHRQTVTHSMDIHSLETRFEGITVNDENAGPGTKAKVSLSISENIDKSDDSGQCHIHDFPRSIYNHRPIDKSSSAEAC